MGENSKIAWTHHTFNPWWGCQKVSDGCLHCYADTFANRLGRKCFGVWPRRPASEKYWNLPLRWNADALLAGERRRVFCASMCDVFEVGAGHNAGVLEELRDRLWPLIRACTGLDWLLLTKRPQNFAWMLPQDLPSNVWLGVTVEHQRAAEERIPLLLQARASVRFLSCEPLLEPLELGLLGTCPRDWGLGYSPVREHLHWVIVGGESGVQARPFDITWARSIHDQCLAAGVAFFMKQVGARTHCGPVTFVQRRPALVDGHWLTDRDGRDPTEWPEDMRVQQFPFETEVLR